jgi:hypothetical protein
MKTERIATNKLERTANVIIGTLFIVQGSIMLGIAKSFKDKEYTKFNRGVIDMGVGDLTDNAKLYQQGQIVLDKYFK